MLIDPFHVYGLSGIYLPMQSILLVQTYYEERLPTCVNKAPCSGQIRFLTLIHLKGWERLLREDVQPDDDVLVLTVHLL